jgi:UDP-N-acetylglucosamine 1-carboxyvinyltransferase
MAENTQKFEVIGGKPLKGTIKVSGSKNAALPILCAALLSNKPSVIGNVPDIADIHTLLEIFRHLNVKTVFAKNTVTIDASGINLNTVPADLICSMRASILLLGPLLATFGQVNLPFPGGCVLGKRSVAAHMHAFKALGAEIIDQKQTLHLNLNKLNGANIIMPELSVTGTENAVMLASIAPGITQIRLAAAEPHVQDLCNFLNRMGSRIKGIGTHFLEIEGVKELNGTNYDITGDYLEAGTFAIAGLVTRGEVKIEGIDPSQLDSFWEKLDETGANYELTKNFVLIKPTENFHAIENLRTAVYPSFATDLQAPFAVLLTQAEGQSKIFETLFEGRLQYLFELEKMGAKVQVLNPHQATVKGPTRLTGVPISSLDLRAGAAMVLAALCAEGTTEISNINYIDRGYEHLDEKLHALGARIQRI